MSVQLKVASASVCISARPPTEHYDKEIQTETTQSDLVQEAMVPNDGFKSPHIRKSKAIINQAPPTLSHPENNTNNESNILVSSPVKSNPVSVQSKPTINIDQVMAKPTFATFLANTSRTIERAINSASYADVLMDYQQDLKLKRSNQSNTSMFPLHIYEHELIKSRPIMDIQPSPRYSELVIVAYGHKLQSSSSGMNISFIVSNQ